MKYDCLIIGGGVSGITSAIIMAKKGYRTAILEKSDSIGPTIRGFEREGLYFDSGFHYTGGLNEGEPLDIFFRYLGLSSKLEKFSFDENGFDSFRCLQPAFDLLFPYGYDRIRERFAQIFPEDSRAIDDYLNTVRRIYHSQPYINLDIDMDSLGLQSIHGPSLKEFLDGMTDNGMLKRILSMHSLLYGVSPEEAPFSLHAFVAGSYYESVNTIKGGGLALANAFNARLHELGVDVYCGSEVTEIFLCDDNSLSGVRYGEDNILNCQICVSTIHPQALIKILPDSAFRPFYRKRIQLLEDTCSAIIVYARSTHLLDILDRTNFFLFPGTSFHNHQISGPVEQKPMFIARARPDKGKTQQDGCIIICPAPNLGSEPWTTSFQTDNSVSYNSLKDFWSSKIIAHVEASYPEFRGNLSLLDCATPLTLKNFTNSPFGSLYGVKHKIDQYNPVPLTKIKDLVLAGQSITAPGIFGATVSGFVACGSIMGHETMIKELRKCA